jgi:hypothetical protein
VPPPGRREVLSFWITGLVITVLSGAIAIYVIHFHLWR